MIKNLMKLYIYTSFTFVSFIILAMIASILDLELVLAIISVFTMLVFIVWFFTAKVILRVLIEEDWSDSEDE